MKNTFNKEWAGTCKLAESEKRSFCNQEKLLDELDNNRDHEASEQTKMSLSHAKILLQETVETEEIDEEKWTKLNRVPKCDVTKIKIFEIMGFTEIF